MDLDRRVAELQCTRPPELARPLAPPSELPQEATIQIEHADRVVELVRHVELVVPRQRDATDPVEDRIAGAPEVELEGHLVQADLDLSCRAARADQHREPHDGE